MENVYMEYNPNFNRLTHPVSAAFEKGNFPDRLKHLSIPNGLRTYVAPKRVVQIKSEAEIIPDELFENIFQEIQHSKSSEKRNKTKKIKA